VFHNRIELIWLAAVFATSLVILEALIGFWQGLKKTGFKWRKKHCLKAGLSLFSTNFYVFL
jgi:hypothetical protein